MEIAEIREHEDGETRQFIEAVTSAFKQGSLVRLTLSKSNSSQGARRAIGRLVRFGDEVKLSVEFEFDKKVETKNFTLQDAEIFLGEVASNDFRALTLFTPEMDLLLQFTKKGLGRIFRSKPTFKQPTIHDHNRAKNYLISADQPYLRHLEISTPSGSVRADKGDKLRQINKFIETFESLLKASGLETKKELRVLDYGSGKSYLTFAIYDFLTRVKMLSAQVVGVEHNSELVAKCAAIAKTVQFSGLQFEAGAIGSVPADGVDVVVALHACDTATDDAIAQAVRAKVPVIAVAPCCQKYVRPLLKVPDSLRFIADHGIMEERLAESVTNGLRAQALRACGYTTKVFEFVSDSHTAKNVMITAVLSSKTSDAATQELRDARKTFGLKDFYLDTLIACLE